MCLIIQTCLINQTQKGKNVTHYMTLILLVSTELSPGLLRFIFS